MTSRLAIAGAALLMAAAVALGWLCTEDCNPGCVQVSSVCDGPDPGAGACFMDSDCDAGMTCSTDECHASGCACDPSTGLWVCDAVCAGACVPE